MRRFQGVATKYLDNYLYWFRWLEIFIFLMVPYLCGMVVSHGRTNELSSSVVPRSDAWVATSRIVEKKD
jgi:hypothetical protein